ncbi:MAG: C39 family peptidase [Oscillospiraceae bacterium]|nr:C39 family peptidase [Oscillospiraceae bacterium]
MDHPTARRVLALLLCAASLLGLSFPAQAETDAYVESILESIALPKVMGTGAFEFEGVTFRRLYLPEYVLERYADSSYAVYPGETDARVGEIKRILNSDKASDLYFLENELVTYTQVRPEVVDYFDDHLAVLFETVYLFFGLEGKTPCLDELTWYLIDLLKDVSKSRDNLASRPEIIAEYRDMLHDIEAVYKYKLTKSGTQGTIARDGATDNLYYFAQTDPDWAATPFEYEHNGDTIKDRGCGCACASMVISTYHKVEITPRWMCTFAIQDNWPVSYGLPDEYFPGIVDKYYSSLETERYGTVVHTPRLLYKSELDMATLADQIGNQGYMAIIHVVRGAFTSQEHYMVLADYREIDGTGYFLVADPYIMPERYSSLDQLRSTGTGNDGLIYATADVLYRDCKAILLFEQDRNDFPLYCRAAAPLTFPAFGG